MRRTRQAETSDPLQVVQYSRWSVRQHRATPNSTERWHRARPHRSGDLRTGAPTCLDKQPQRHASRGAWWVAWLHGVPIELAETCWIREVVSNAYFWVLHGSAALCQRRGEEATTIPQRVSAIASEDIARAAFFERREYRSEDCTGRGCVRSGDADRVGRGHRGVDPAALGQVPGYDGVGAGSGSGRQRRHLRVGAASRCVAGELVAGVCHRATTTRSPVYHRGRQPALQYRIPDPVRLSGID
eukprot:ctg_1014.g322